MLETLTNQSDVWHPQDGPQSAAFNSLADVIGYGGAAGGGKTDLLLGLAGTQHHRAIIFRREFPRLEGIEARSREIFNATAESRLKDRYNESLHRWELSSGATVRFAAMQYEDDKKGYQGRPFDFYGFDEVTEFSESQVRFVTAWNRSTRKGQRCRVVLTFNPPTDDAGMWVVTYFAPWLDPQHPNPAADGELRWYAMVDGKEVERPDSAPFEHKGETVTPRSRTFFHAGLADNPILAATGYSATIDALPEPLRSILKGNFAVGATVNPFQVIPAAWVRAANARWLERNLETADIHGAQSALGADISRGGDDQTVIAPLYGDWFAPLHKFPGVSVPDGPTAAGLIIAAMIGTPAIGVDVIGYGASACDSLTGAGIVHSQVNFSAGTDNTDKSGQLRLRNVRAAAYWLFREALDPEQGEEKVPDPDNPGQEIMVKKYSTICLPPDPELLADLCAPHWFLDRGSGKVQVEDKDAIKKRLGRSPDSADAVVLAWWAAGNSGPLYWSNE